MDRNEEINKILGIKESYKAPETLLKILLKNDDTTRDVFIKMLELFEKDISYDWFHEYFQSEHADRKNKKQDFTPMQAGRLVHCLHFKTDGIIYEPTCGTGGLIINHFNLVMKKYSPLTLKPSERFYICEELSDRAIPFLIFNLAVRGLDAFVVQCDVLTRKATNFYSICNINNDCLDFSEVKKIDNETAKKLLEEQTSLKYELGD